MRCRGPVRGPPVFFRRTRGERRGRKRLRGAAERQKRSGDKEMREKSEERAAEGREAGSGCEAPRAKAEGRDGELREEPEEREEQTGSLSGTKREAEDRKARIVGISLLGICVNLLLVLSKGAVGFFSNSIAIMLDAVNNLSDVLSASVTLVGAKLAGKDPDREHPLGHGRIEYISAIIVALLVLYAGIASGIESAKKILHPAEASYSALSLGVMAAAIAVKLALGRHTVRQGEKWNSSALRASGRDAEFDALLTASVLLSALIYMNWGVSLEAYVAAVISAMIVKAGLDMIMDTLDDILGRRADSELVQSIKDVLMEEPEIRGVYDLLVNNYGPDKNYASVRLELPDYMTVEQLDRLSRRAEERVYRETGVILTGIGVYSFNTGDSEAALIRNRVQSLVMEHSWALQLHGYHVDMEAKQMRFDVVMSFDIDPREGLRILYRELEEAYPEYRVRIAADTDIADIQ